MSDFDITEEFATANGLSPEQVAAVKTYGSEFHTSSVAELKKGWDGEALKNAEGILDTVVSSTQSAFKVDLPRNQGEKHAEYLIRLNTHVLTSGQSKVNELKLDYEAKLKDFDGDKGTKEELETAKIKLDDAQKKLANYDDLTEKASSVDSLSEENSKLTKLVTYGAVKPIFPDTANVDSINARWSEFIAATEKEWDVKLVDGVPTAINKENPHKTEKLEALVSKNEALTILATGRSQKGSGAKEIKEYEGIPFAIPVGATTKDHVELIRTQIAKEGIDSFDDRYSVRFKELTELIKQKTATN